MLKKSESVFYVIVAIYIGYFLIFTIVLSTDIKRYSDGFWVYVPSYTV